jgi:arylsulfatase
MFGPRGVLQLQGHRHDDPTEQPRWGRIGRQTIEDSGPLTRKRMETIDDETSDAAVDYIKRQAQGNRPFFCWFNSTRMHAFTHVKAEHRDKPGLTSRTEYNDGMIEHDGHVGKLLKALDDAGIADNTIVLYTTDNGPHKNSWPDAGISPFRNEKATNWEGAFRVPCVIRWPGKIKPGSVSNEIVSAHDWLPTFLAAAGDADVVEKLKKGTDVGGKTFKVHVDGYNQLPYLTGQVEKSPRRGFFYFNDDGDLVGVRVENWKIVFMEQRAPAPCASGPSRSRRCECPRCSTCTPTPTSRPTSPPTATTRGSRTALHRLAGSTLTGEFLQTFKDFPPASARRRSPSIRRWKS